MLRHRLLDELYLSALGDAAGFSAALAALRLLMACFVIGATAWAWHAYVDDIFYTKRLTEMTGWVSHCFQPKLIASYNILK
jgi:hypothetical protein